MPPTTRKADGRLRSVVWLLVPVALGLVIALGYYLIFYVRAREQYFTERAFRSLAVLSEQVEDVIAGLDSAIRNAAATEKPWDTIELVPHLEYVSCAELPHDCPRGPGMSMCVGWTGADSSETSSARLSSQAALRINPTLRRSARLYFSYRPLAAAESTVPPSPPPAGVSPATGGSRRKLVAHTAAAVRAPAGSSTAPPTPTATPTCALTPSPAPRNESLCASADLSELLRPLLGSSAFDDFDVFLASDDGSILFERGRSGLRLAHLASGGKGSGDGQKDGQGGPTSHAQGLPTIDALQGASALNAVSLSQVTYQLFTHPVRLVVPAHVSRFSDQAATNGAADQRTALPPVWVLGGLVSQSSFAGQSHAISFAVMSYVPLAVLLLVLALPVLKVWVMGPRDRLRTRDVYLLAVCTVAGTAVLTVFGLTGYAYHELKQSSDEQLEIFASKLCGNFHQEVAAAYDALAQFVAERAQRQAIKFASLQDELTRKHVSQKIRCKAQNKLDALIAHPLLEKVILKGGSVELPKPQYSSFKLQVTERYSFFEGLTWSDRTGWQREKWTVRGATTNLIKLTRFDSFQDAKSERLWSFSGDTHGDSKASGSVAELRRLILNLQISPNTGEPVPTLSIPIYGKGRSARDVLGVAMMFTDWGSLLEPLVPPGLGFAVIQSDGEVLFHSDIHRNLHENLFDEAEPDRALRARVFARHADVFDAEYHGRAQRFYVHPIEDTPWTLVAFRDKELLRTVQLEIVVPCVLLLLAYALLYALTALVVRLVWPEERGGWLWPSAQRTGTYLQCTAVLSLATVYAAWAIAVCCMPVAVAACTLVAWAGVAFVFVKLSQGGRAPVVLRLVGYGVLAGAGAAVTALAACAGSLALQGAWVVLATMALLSLASGDALGRLAMPSRRVLTSAYVGMGIALLVLVAMLPAVALFRDAYRQESEAFVRLRQLEYAEALAERAAWLKDKYQPWLTPALFERRLQRPTDNAVTDLHPAALQGGALPSDAPEACSLCARLPQGVTGVVLERFPVYSRESQELRELIYDRASDGRWTWAADRSRGRATLSYFDDRFRTTGASPWSDQGRYAVEADIPSLAVPSWKAVSLLLIGMLLVGMGVFGALRAVARAIFGIHVEGESAPGDSACLLTSCLLLQPERRVVEIFKENAAVIDLLGCDDPPTWKDWLAVTASDLHDCVVVDHFEYRRDDLEWRRAKLELLEELVLNRSPIVTVVSGFQAWGAVPLPVDVRRQGKAVVVASEVDPLPYLARQPGAQDEPTAGAKAVTSDEISRWARVFGHLGKIRAERLHVGVTTGTNLAQTLYEECRWTEQLRGIAVAIRLDPNWDRRSRDALVEYVGDLADAHYRDLWGSCSDEERLVLIHMAAEGFVNPRNWETVRHLMHRHLVRHQESFQLMNESFSRFVLAVESEEQVAQWEKAGGASLWAQWRTALLVLLAIGGVFLFVTQPDRLNSWLGFLGALAGGLATLTKLFGVFPQGKEGAEARPRE